MAVMSEYVIMKTREKVMFFVVFSSYHFGRAKATCQTLENVSSLEIVRQVGIFKIHLWKVNGWNRKIYPN